MFYEVLPILEETTTYKNRRDEIDLLWRENVSMPNSFWLAKKQFISLEDYLEKQPAKPELYDQTVAKDLERQFIEYSKDSNDGDCWFLSEHAVTNPNKPGKLRRVSNAASKYKGVCLNDMLVSGSDLFANMTGLIMRFREGTFVVSSDIEARFMQVSVPEEQRRYLKFLWGNRDNPLVYRYLRHIVGAKC